jgi:hypothetical protein
MPTLPLPIPPRFAPPPVVITPAPKPTAPTGENGQLPLGVPEQTKPVPAAANPEEKPSNPQS